MLRLIILFHRYLGIAIGLVMLMWCLSGFVMVYMPYPGIKKQQALDHLPPLSLKNSQQSRQQVKHVCCQTDNFDQLKLVDIHRFSIEMLADEPVIRFRGSQQNNPIVNLNTGQIITTVDRELAEKVIYSSPTITSEYLSNSSYNYDEQNRFNYRRLEKDQWTVTSYYQPHRPFHHFSETYSGQQAHWYVSSLNGEIFQQTTQQQRFWNYLGAVPHWLYPAALRQHQQPWSLVVIVLSGLGVFLTVTGLWIGVVRFKKLPSNRRSPYIGWGLWHHYSGLVFGVVLLTWVFSGLVSINPARAFDLSGGYKERQQLQGIPLSVDEVTTFVNQLPENFSKLFQNKTIKRIEGYALRSQFYFLAIEESGQYQRYNARTFELENISETEKDAIIHSVREHDSVLSESYLTEEDNYYYSNHDHSVRDFPVYKVILDNEDKTLFYINAISGEISGFYSTQQRWYRWLFFGLHSLDFHQQLRTRPLWDIIVWILLLGATGVAFTGSYLGIKRVFKSR